MFSNFEDDIATAPGQQTLRVVESDKRFLDRDGISLVWQCIAFAIAAAVFFSKKPDLFLHSQFYAEDGHDWYAEAYNLGWLSSLRVPDGGYLNTLPRLFTGIALLLPLRIAPLIMNSAGLLIETLPITALLSARCRTWGSLPLRMLMAFIYLLMPRAMELHVVLTNAQWHLVVLEMLIAFGRMPRRWFGRLSDLVLFVVGGLSGPFSLLLFPLVLVYWQRTRQRWTLGIATMLGIGAAVQLFILLHFGRHSTGILGAEPLLLLRILGSRIILFSIFRPRGMLFAPPTWILVAAVLLGMVVLGFCLRFAGLPLRLQIIFTAGFLGMALHSPWITGNGTLWQLLLSLPLCRYWYFPMLVFLWSAAWCLVSARARTLKLVGGCILLPMFLGVTADWRYETTRDQHFADYVQRFQQASPGDHVVIPIYPDGWTMELIKH